MRMRVVVVVELNNMLSLSSSDREEIVRFGAKGSGKGACKNSSFTERIQSLN